MRSAVAFVVLVWSVLLLGCATPAVTDDPHTARFVYDDIDRFWAVMDEADDQSRAALLQRDYVQSGSPGVRGFTRSRIISGERLAETIAARPDAYDADARARMLRLREQEPRIRDVFVELKRLYPPAVFPDVYFVVGRLNSGGTTSRAGLIIGAEMYAADDEAMRDIPHIVAHEWAHFNQDYPHLRTLLAKAIQEGSADFIGELASGAHVNQEAHAFGIEREREVWSAFEAVMRERYGTRATDLWLYGGSPFEGGPADLGYFVGYRICEAYYEQADDKQAAIAEMLTTNDFEAFLEASGYADRFGDPPSAASD